MLRTHIRFSCLIACIFSGCQPTIDPTKPQTSATEAHDQDTDHEHDAGHAHEEHAETFAEAVAAIEKQGAMIIGAFSDGKPEDAHDALHEIGHLIEELPELATKEKFDSELKKQVNEAKEKLMDAFGELDDTLHGGEAKNVDDVKLEVERSMKSLKSISMGKD